MVQEEIRLLNNWKAAGTCCNETLEIASGSSRHASVGMYSSDENPNFGAHKTFTIDMDATEDFVIACVKVTICTGRGVRWPVESSM